MLEKNKVDNLINNLPVLAQKLAFLMMSNYGLPNTIYNDKLIWFLDANWDYVLILYNDSVIVSNIFKINDVRPPVVFEKIDGFSVYELERSL